MSQQGSFLSQFARDVMLPMDSHVTQPADVRRLSTQNDRLLARLRRGPATNRELATISLKYTSRISDLRKAGYTVTASVRRGGLTIYTLEEQP